MSEGNKNDNQSTKELMELRRRLEDLEKSESALKQVTKALHEGDGLFKSFYKQSPIAIEIYDINGDLLDANPACLELFGVQNVQEVRGFDLFADPNVSAEGKVKLENGEQISFESTFDFELVKYLGLYNTSRSGVCFIECQITPIKQTGETLSGYLVHVRDITERRQFIQAIEQSEKRFRSLIEHSTDAITLVNEKGQVTYESPSTRILTGYTAEERLGRSGFELIHPDDLAGIKAAFASVFTRPGHIENAHFRSIRKDGTVWWTEGTAVNLLNDPAVKAIVINYRDITERVNAEKALRDMNEQLNIRVAEIEELHIELRQQALRDPLTGLYNRRYLEDALKREMARVTREKKNMSIIMMDIDEFKEINDTYGHQVGDIFLKMIANLIAGRCRTTDIACRYGGDEFLLVMPGTSLRTASNRAEELRVGCSEIHIPYEGKNLKVTMSFGVAAYPKHGKQAEEIVIKSDKALYRSKNRGRNQVSVWSDGWGEEMNGDR